jgi:hypothetical protein
VEAPSGDNAKRQHSGDGHRHQSIGGGVVPELPSIVQPPAVGDSAADQSARVLTSRRRKRGKRKPAGNGHRCESGDRGTITKLSADPNTIVIIVTPTECRSVRRQTAGVSAAGRKPGES